MIKKRILQTTAILTTACIFSACTKKAEQQPVVQMTEQQPVVQMTEQQPDTEESNLERTTDLAGMTEDVETSVCIDYVIESYKISNSSDTACFHSKSTAKIL